jgi:ferritin-like metal-binding protein YciE
MMKKELQKLYSIETQLLDGLKVLSAMAESPQLKQGLEAHRTQTQAHTRRLETICGKMGWSPVGVASKTMKAMQVETLETLNGAEPSSVTDAMIIAAAQKAEHLEIACYGTAATLALVLGDEQAAGLLHETLEEEKQTDQLLTQIAEAGINQRALRQGDAPAFYQ